MKNSIKINRALNHVNLLPMAREHVMNNIPDCVIDALTSKQLVELMLAYDRHFRDGISHAEKEINDYIGLPQGVDFWAVVGDDFDDGLNIADILQKRGTEFKNESKRNK